MTSNKVLIAWTSYANYARKIVVPNSSDNLRDIDYWRDEIFFAIISFLAPVSIIALVPSVIMSFLNGIPVLGFADLIAFGLVLLVLFARGMPIRMRKSIFVLMFYILSVIILYYLDKPGPGLLFLLTSTMLSSVIYSAAAGFYSACINIFICTCFGLCILFRVNIPIVADYSLGTWTAISCTVTFISFVCAESLNMLLGGLKTSLDDSRTLAANLKSIIESADSLIYSLDRDFRYITFNHNMKDRLNESYHIEIKAGDHAFEFLENLLPEEALFWKNTYNEALTGKPLKFERDFNFGGNAITTSFSFNAIVDSDKITGLSCFATDITEQKNLQRKIQRLNDDLEIKVMERTAQLVSANKELEAFSYSVSHDLRAPLRGVNGYAQMLKEDYGRLLGPDANRIVDNIMHQAKKMGQLIDDLLTFSRIGRKELANSEIIMQEMVENICDNLRNENSNRTIEFKINKLVPANGDTISINQVWVNLISNAVKYTKQKAKAIIKIGCEIKGEEILYYVKDNGAGFDMQYAGKLFGVFQRLHSDDEFEGTGVGLAIVHRIISKHGGRIWAEAKVNKGAAFFFTLT